MNKKELEKLGYDVETLRRWKNSSTRAKLNWLDSALKFGKAKKT